ncbi:MAG: hypothetical protein QGG54_14695 [Gammaproteobacteria bacterium]|nr:hypothetical protein [Gammaproteobacteria bacterium]
MTALQAFAPAIFSQLAYTMFLLVALGAAQAIRNIRGRYGRLRFSPRYAIRYVGRQVLNS